MVELRRRAAADAFRRYTILGDEVWLNRTNNTYSNGSVMFTLGGAKGYFRVVYRLYWYLSGQVSGSTTAVAYVHFDNRADKRPPNLIALRLTVA